MTNLRFTLGMFLIFGTALPAHVLAETFIVDNAADPNVGDAANCTAPAQPLLCSLRDALAAADATPGLDAVVFAITDAIYLGSPLIVEQPVSIDGGTGTEIRVNQGYNVKILDDVFKPFGPRLTLQPTYFSLKGASSRPMLRLRGDGSTVRNLVMDGSITPMAGEPVPERIDYNSDNQTDYFLYTNDGGDGQGRWLIAGGIGASFFGAPSRGSVEISSNELRNFNSNAIALDTLSGALIANNIISGGYVGRPFDEFSSSSGITIYDGGGFTISNNRVTDYHAGISLSVTSALTVSDNELSGNGNGLELWYSNTSFGAIMIENNESNDNFDSGILVNSVSGATIVNNEVKSNGSYGINIASAELIDVHGNQVAENGSHPAFHGGIRIAEAAFISVTGNEARSNSGFGIVIDSAYGNTVADNDVQENGGAGIVLFGSAQANTVEFNESHMNWTGILVLANPFAPDAYPNGNFIRENTLSENIDFDAEDDLPVCLNAWTNNEFKTSYAASGECIQ